MHTEFLGPYDYITLQTCPFCGRKCLVDDRLDCAHFVVAFQDGFWVSDSCPPVFCNGFQFHRGLVENELKRMPGVVSKSKPGTLREPEIEAFFCLDEEVARLLRKKYRKIPVLGPPCGECGNRTCVVGEDNEILCAICGERGYAPDLDDSLPTGSDN